MKTTKTIRNILIAIAGTLCVIILAPSCKSTPPQAADIPVPIDPNTLAPEQDALDRMEAAKARAQLAREQSLAVQAQAFFYDEWNAAEASNEAGKKTGTDTVGQVNGAIALFTTAATGWEALTEKSAPLFADGIARDNARVALDASAARMRQSRVTAENNKGPTYFPDDWKAAEDLRQQAEDSTVGTLEEINAATELYTSAADSYDGINGKISARLAQEQDDSKQKEAAQKALAAAQAALQAATQRAEKSRQSAMDVEGQTYFAADWRNAESRLQTARSAKKGTEDEIKAATTQFTGAADAYDSIAGKARAQFTKDKDAASKDLQAAIARAQKSRTAVTTAKADATFATDWKNAETKNQTATNAKRSTTAEMKAAAPLYNAAADAYDEIVRKNTVRVSATDAVAKAKARSEQSITYAETTGRTLEGNNAQ